MADLPSKKSAPRREVIEVIRNGDWGDITYRHRLSCGHVEIRKRPSPAPHIACLACVAGKLLDQRTPPATPTISFDPLVDPPATDETLDVEMDINSIRAGLAARFALPADAIDVVFATIDGTIGLAYATVFLDAAHARRLAAGAPKGHTLTDVSP